MKKFLFLLLTISVAKAQDLPLSQAPIATDLNGAYINIIYPNTNFKSGFQTKRAPSSLFASSINATPPLNFSTGTVSFPSWPANASGVLTNNGSGILSWATPISQFQLLTDGPGSFTSHGLNYTRVNVGATALEYRTTSQVLSDISAAPATSGNSILYGNGTGGFSNVTIGSGLSFSTGTLSVTALPAWGSITGTLSSQTDLQNALNAKQNTITFGTGVQTALGVNIGSAGAPVLFNGAGGTPSSLSLTNATGMPLSGITGLGTGIPTWMATPSSSNLASALTDETGTGAAVFAGSPAFTGTPTTSTPSAVSNNTTIANTAYVDRYYKNQSVSISSNIFTLDFASTFQSIFYNTTAITANFTLALSNASNALSFEFKFKLNGSSLTMTCPNTFTSLSSDSNWNSSTQIYTFTGTMTNVYYNVTATYNTGRGVWEMVVSNSDFK